MIIRSCSAASKRHGSCSHGSGALRYRMPRQAPGQPPPGYDRRTPLTEPPLGYDRQTHRPGRFKSHGHQPTRNGKPPRVSVFPGFKAAMT